MQIVYKPTEDIKPYGKNPRKNDEAVTPVANSIKTFGFKVPIVIDNHNIIVAGHTRWKAAKQLGLAEVPCIIADDLTPSQVKAFRLADNKTGEIAEWDLTLLESELAELAGEFNFGDFGFESLEPIEDIQEDNFDTESAIDSIGVPTTKLGEVWQLGRHRLMCGDSTVSEDVEKLLGGSKADMMLTDPPYNVDYGEKAEAINPYGYHFSPRRIENDKMSDSEFLAFLTKAFDNARNSIKQGGAFYIWHASSTLYEFETALKRAGMQTRQQLIWNKNSLVLGRQDYQWKHEPCLYGWIDGAAHFFVDDRRQTTVFEDEVPDFRKMKKDELVALLAEIFSDKVSTTILNENRPTSSPEHPTMKPIKLMARLIRNSTNQEQTVLDLFGGSGSTLIAAEQLNRACFMMEYDPKYTDVIIQRWETLTGETAVKIDG